MNELHLIKKELHRKDDKLIHLLESVGCDYVIKTDGEISGSRPTGDAKRGFSVYLDERLKAVVWTRKVYTRDIFDLISYFKFGETNNFDRTLTKSKNFIIETCDLKRFKKSHVNDMPDYNFFLRKAQKKRVKRSKNKPNPTLPDSVMNEFIHLPHQKWIKDGIDVATQIKFEVCFDVPTSRICFPVRNEHGDIVGVRGRTTIKEDEENVKYFPIYPFAKSKELYGLDKNINNIVSSNQVLVFESEKSVLKADMFDFSNSVSVMGSDISDVQVSKIHRNIPNGKVIICPDKDKSPEDIKKIAEPLFEKYDQVYAMVDTKNKLQDKQAPVDIDKETFDFLYKNCVYPIKK